MQNVSVSGVSRVGERNESVHFAWWVFILFIFMVLGGFSFATQVFAWLVGYHPDLGEPVFQIAGMFFYYPWEWFVWSFRWSQSGGQLGEYVVWMNLAAIGGVTVALLGGYYLLYKRSFKREKVNNLHGSARFATEDDLERMGLLPAPGKSGRGVYVGAIDTKEGRKVLRYNDKKEKAHLLCIAPTRSGKGVGLVLPTLLSYPDSTCTNDIKKENYELTSGFRHQAGSLVVCFEPTYVGEKSIDGQTITGVSGWNVLDEVRIWTEYDVMDAQNIAAAIADPDAKGMDDHWVSTSYELLTGLILHVLYAEPNKSLAGCGNFLADPSFTDTEQIFLHMRQNVEHDPEGKMGWVDTMGRPTKVHPVVALCASAMEKKEEKERNSVLSTAKTRLALYLEPIVARNTTISDFSIRDLMNHDKPVSLYLVVSPSDKERLRPLLRLFFTFLIRRLTSNMKFEDGEGANSYLHRLLLLIDELPALKKLEILQDGLGYIAGYGITAYLFVQDKKQLVDAYTQNESITSGCHVTVSYAPNTYETAEEISKKTGITTVKKQSVSYSGKRMGAMLDNMNVSEDDVQRNLLTADEVMKLPRDESLIFMTGEPTIRAKKIVYYNMPEFSRRAKLSAPARIGMKWLAHGFYHTNWLMLSVERVNGGLMAYINVYSDYPEVAAFIKQRVLATGEIITLPCELLAGGKKHTGPLTLEHLEFQLKYPEGTDFDAKEAFEVHLNVTGTGYEELTQTGFYQAISIYEREAREAAREWFRKHHDEKVTFDPIGRDMICRGKVVLDHGRCIVIERDIDSASIHRKELLDQVPVVGQQCLIRYKNYQGTVELR